MDRKCDHQWRFGQCRLCATRKADVVNRLPHRFPPRETWPHDDPECLAWRCWECGQTVSEMKPRDQQPGCTVDWRKEPLRKRVVNAWKELINAAES